MAKQKNRGKKKTAWRAKSKRKAGRTARAKIEIQPFATSIDALVAQSRVGGKNARSRIQRQGRFKRAIGPTLPMKMAQLLKRAGFKKASTRARKAFGPVLPPTMRLSRGLSVYRKNKCHSAKTGLACTRTVAGMKTHTKALKRWVNRL